MLEETTVQDTALAAEPILLLIDAEEEAYIATPDYQDAKITNYCDVLTSNIDASRVDPETLAAFIELVFAVDDEYIDTGIADVPAITEPLLNWNEMGDALAESQALLKTMQDLLSLTLEEMGVEDHSAIRIYEDMEGKLRLLVPHDRQEEIEEKLNSPENKQLHELHRAVASGMHLAGNLIGQGALPQEVLDIVKAQQQQQVTA
jgi:hypothetical protein